MRLQCMLLLIMGFLTGCAFIDGLHQQDSTVPENMKITTKKPVKTAPVPQNNPSEEANKMISTITQ